MTATQYKLKFITDLSFSGFDYTIPDNVLHIINQLCSHVGATEVRTNVFNKSAVEKDRSSSALADGGAFKSATNKKRRGNKGMEVSGEEWESIRTFQATKLEQKSGIDADIDQLRLLLNKLSDKTFLDIREKLLDKLNRICEIATPEDLQKIALIIYDISSANKFYSKIFADLFSELLTTYKWLQPMFEAKYGALMEIYRNIHYVSPEENYDGFCDMNKANEKRRAVTTFFVNLATNGIIPNSGIVSLLKDLLEIVTRMVNEPDKKNEVDEITEYIAILYNKSASEYNDDAFKIGGKTIIEVVTAFAKCKAKDYVSLSNKAIFKFMDLVEM